MPRGRKSRDFREILLTLWADNSKINTLTAFLRVQQLKFSTSHWVKWRAVLRVIGQPRSKRLSGQPRSNAILTVQNLLDRISFRISNEERDRVMNIVKIYYGSMSQGVQLSFKPSVATIHQIYGLLRDGKAMPEHCAISERRWREVAQQIDAHYAAFRGIVILLQ